MSKRSNTSVHTAAIVSRTRTKLNGTKTLCIYDAIRGLVQHYLDMQLFSTSLQRDPTMLILADTVERISHALAYPRPLILATKLQLLQNMTGRCG
jgi:hypothetical protein